MTLEEIYYVSQVVSTIVLILSVVYLGRQTKQAGKNQIAQMHQARNEQFHEYMLKLADPEFGPLARAGFRADSEPDDDQILRFYYYTVTLLRFFEEMYRQSRDGMISAERWNTSKGSLGGILRAPGVRASYMVLRGLLDPGFVALADELIDRGKGSPLVDSVAEWRTAAAADLAGSQAGRSGAASNLPHPTP